MNKFFHIYWEIEKARNNEDYLEEEQSGKIYFVKTIIIKYYVLLSIYK